jgi:hypothetical protein
MILESHIQLFKKNYNRYSAWDKAVLGTTCEEWFRWWLVCMELDQMQEVESNRLLQEVQLDVSNFYENHSFL